jgi:hypothetical protein
MTDFECVYLMKMFWKARRIFDCIPAAAAASGDGDIAGYLLEPEIR